MELTRLRFNLTVAEIEKETEVILKHWKYVEDLVANTPKHEITYENTAKLLSDLEGELSARVTNVTFRAHVATDKHIRDACSKAEEITDDYSIKSQMRNDVYQVIKHLHQDKKEMDKLNPECKRYVDRLIRDFERNGLHLEKETQDEVSTMKQRLSKLGIEFQKNLNEENTILHFTKDELKGLSVDFLKGLEPVTEGSDKFKIPLNYPHVFPILQRCQVPSTRKEVEVNFNRRCIDKNVALLEEMVELRSKVAKLLGHSTHAAYILDTRMAKTPKAVDTFLTDLDEKLIPLGKKDLDNLLKLKLKECGDRNLKFDGKVNMWDFRYYMNMYEEQQCNLDQEKIREYFPVDLVTKELLRMYEELLSLKYVEINNPHVWHKDVRMFAAYDTRVGREGELVGHFYLDLHPREGKYGHAACFGLQSQFVKENGEKEYSAAAMVSNFTAPTKDRESLLTHSEVVTYFHEFGHVMHQVCSESTLSRFSGTAVERDFVEAPSQMLENWCWEKEPLQRLSGHYKDRKKPLPDDLIKRLISTRNVNTGLLNKRQTLFSIFDQTIHTSEKADTAKILAKLQAEILMIEMTPDTNFAASFGHLAGGYDAQYYGYLWSQVFSMDMFETRFKKEGLFNPKVGLQYRELILARGGTVDASEMLKDFLGREPNDEAFLKKIGL